MAGMHGQELAIYSKELASSPDKMFCILAGVKIAVFIYFGLEVFVYTLNRIILYFNPC
jgi:hypothetical protein